MSDKTLKNGFNVKEVPWSIYVRQKKNQVFKLLPLKEENGDWETQQKTLIIELGGLNSLTVDKDVINLKMMSKLSGLTDVEDFMVYRKTVFEIMSLLEEWK